MTDLGGGSTELVLGVDAPAAAYSMNTGSVRVTERYLADGVTPASEAAARDHVRALLDRAGAVVDLGSARELVGLAGTITTVTAHALGLESFEPEAIDGARLDVGTALASCEAIVHSTAAERESWGYLRPGRRDVIAAGALVWSEVIARVAEATAARGHRLTHTVTSLHDILDGIIFPENPTFIHDLFIFRQDASVVRNKHIVTFRLSQHRSSRSVLSRSQYNHSLFPRSVSRTKGC